MQLFFQKNRFKVANVEYIIKNAPEKNPRASSYREK